MNFFEEQKNNSAEKECALTLLEISSLNKESKEYPRQLAILSHVFSNPLCQTIFAARLRIFSDYETSKELSKDDADQLITLICNIQNELERVKKCFDFLNQFKPFPASQNYITEIDVKEITSTCLSKHSAPIDSNKLRHKIASIIEQRDWTSTRTYDELMQEIDQALNQTQSLPPIF